MALRPPTQEEIADLQKQGVYQEGGMIDDPSLDPRQPMSGPAAALATAKAHAGGTIGGGAGALGIGALAAPWLAGPEAGIPADIAMLLLGAGGAAGGSYLGQKAQQAILPKETEQALEQQAAQAAQEHPYISTGTDIATSAIASGGSFSPSTAGRAVRSVFGRDLMSAADREAMNVIGQPLSEEGAEIAARQTGDKAALKNVLLQSAINPALNAGVSYAATGELPSGKDILAQSIGGALFAKPAGWTSRLGNIGRPPVEPTPELTMKGPIDIKNQPEELSKVNVPQNEANVPIPTKPPIGMAQEQSQQQQEQHPFKLTTTDEHGNVKYNIPPKTQEELQLEQKGVQPNAIQEPSTSGVVSHPQEGAGETGSERGGMGQGNERKEVTQEGTGKEVSSGTPVPTSNDVSLMGGIGKIFRSGIDTIRAIAHPLAQPLADAFHRTLVEKEQLLGSQWNPVGEYAKKLSSRDDAQLQKISEYENQNKQAAPSTMFQNDRQKQAYLLEKQALEKNYQNRLANKEPVMDDGRPRLPISDPFYHPTTTNPKVAAVYRENTDTKQMAKLDKIYLDYQTKKLGIDPAKAASNLQEYKQALQGTIKSVSSGNQSYFNAARLAQGNSLPPEFTRPGWAKNLEAYFHAQAADNSYYKHIETNPQAMQALGYSKDPWGNKIEPHENNAIVGNTAVKNVLNEIRGEAGKGLQGQVQKKLESAATALFLGPATEFHKLASNIGKLAALADNPYQGAKIVTHAIINMAEGWTHAKENGKIVMSAKSAMDMLDGQLTAADRIAGVARLNRQIYTLNDLTEKWNMGILQAGCEDLARYKLHSAEQGNKADQRLLRGIDPDYTPGKIYDKQGISQLASGLAGVIHGTRDARTLPAWMLHDNEVSAFFKLASWGVAQTNSFMRDVWTPAVKDHNYLPMLNATFGAAVGGYMIKELREKLTGKASQIPSLKEIMSSSRGLEGNIPALAYNAMAAASYAGFGGMLSTIGRYPFDWAFKNTPQGATFPLDTIISETANTISKASEAIANDPNLNWLTLATQVGQHLMGTNFQLGRIAMNQAINSGLMEGTIADKKLLSDKLGDLRRFDMVEGIPYESQDQASNSFMNLEQKRFKMEQDPQKALAMVPDLVHNIITTYGDKPDVMMQKLKALKSNQYATVPSMEDTPIEFMRFWQYLNKERGPEEAKEAIADYLKHKVINEAKGSIIP